MATLLPNGKQAFLNAAGTPAVGWKIQTYAAGTVVPKQTFSDAAGAVPNANPTILDARGEAVVFWSGAYKVQLLDNTGAIIWTVDNVQSADSYATASVAALIAQLANSGLVAEGDAMIAVKTTKAGAVATTQHQVNEERISVFQYMTAAQIADVVAKTYLVDVTAALQLAINNHQTCWWPEGGYRISAKLVMPQFSRHYGAGPDNGTVIKGTHAGRIFEYVQSNANCHIEGIRFSGIGCTAIAVDPSAGTLHDYLIGFQVFNCSFTYELAFGINADCIFLNCNSSEFGGAGGPGAGANLGTMVCLKSFSVGANFTNINVVRNCRFYNSTAAIGAASAVAVQLSGGSGWSFEYCDWEQAGQAISCSNITRMTLYGCWFEALTAALQILDFAAAVGKVVIENCEFANLTSGICMVQWNSAASPGLVIKNCMISLNGGMNVLFDNATGSTQVSGATFVDKVEFHDNIVTGGSGTIVTATQRTGNPALQKGWAIVTTSAGAPVTVASSEPLTFGRNGVGDVNINLTNLAASTAARICANATPQGALARTAVASGIATGATIRVLLFNAAGVAVEDTFMVTWQGS